jgi:hypothetical protein
MRFLGREKTGTSEGGARKVRTRRKGCVGRWIQRNESRLATPGPLCLYTL